MRSGINDSADHSSDTLDRSLTFFIVSVHSLCLIMDA